MFDPSVAALFPLPLTTFERYMLLDDRSDYPMAFVLNMKLRGELHREAFESSLDEALSVHPLLCAVVKRSNRGALVWTLAEGLKPTVDWGALGAAISPRGDRIDLGSEVGLRVWVRQGNGVADLVLQFHHATCDGVGSMRFVGHLLAAYGIRTALGGECPKLQPGDPAELVRRGHFAAPTTPSGNRIRRIRASIRDGYRWLSRRPAILNVKNGSLPDGAARPTFLESHLHTFDQSETKRLCQAGVRQGVTVNDLMLRDMFQTLHQWDAGQQAGSRKRWLRIAVPVNLRTGDDTRISAANGISYTFLTRDDRQCADSRQLLRGISEETTVFSRRRRALLFLRGFELMERIPGATRLYMGRSRCFATVVLSNLGDFSRQFGATFPRESGKVVAGNIILEDIFGAPPVRPNTRAAVMVGGYDRRLWVCLRCDSQVFSASEARRLLSSFVGRIEKTMADETVC